jgi:hypothetical protein
LGGGQNVTQPFFEVLSLMLLDVKHFVTWQDKASKNTFFLKHLIFQSNFGLK